MKKESLTYQPIIIVFVALALCFPMLLHGVPYSAHDAHVHLMWGKHFSDQFWGGEIYPRWILNADDGFSSPGLFYYPPIGYYIFSLLTPFFSYAQDATQQLAASFTLALLASGLAFYWFMRSHVTKFAAMCAAIAYIALPYHILIDTYARASYAESWSFVWLPFMLLIIDKIATGSSKYWPALPILACLMFMTHPPSCLLAIPFALLYALAHSLWGQKKPLIFARTIGAICLGAMMAGIYLSTALTHGELMNADKMFEKLFYYANNFVFGETKADNPMMSLLPGLTLVNLFICVLAFSLFKQTQPGTPRMLLTLSGITAAMCVFMMSSYSRPLWEIFPLAQKIQFPWRIHVIMSLVTAISIALTLNTAQQGNNTNYAKALRGLLLTIIALLCISMTIFLDYYAARNKEAPPKYNTASIGNIPVPTEYIIPSSKNRSEIFTNEQKAITVSGHADISITSWQPRHISLKVNAIKPSLIAIRQSLYPGWVIKADNRHIKQSNDITPYAVIGFGLPKGHHQVDLTLKSTPYEKEGHIVTAIGFCIWFICTGFIMYRARKKQTAS